MLGKSPVSHDVCGDEEKNIARNSLGCDIESQPLVNLRSIICTGDNIEQESRGNDVSPFTARSPQVPQLNVAIEIRHLADQPEPKPNLHLQIAHRSVKRVIHVVSYVWAECPIVGAVPEDIRDRWRGMAEPVHEEGFHDPFEVVETPIVHGQSLDREHWPFIAIAEVFVDIEVVEERVYD